MTEAGMELRVHRAALSAWLCLPGGLSQDQASGMQQPYLLCRGSAVRASIFLSTCPDSGTPG